jgi:hypothetical protein
VLKSVLTVADGFEGEVKKRRLETEPRSNLGSFAAVVTLTIVHPLFRAVSIGHGVWYIEFLTRL